jgi:hypothetical protein
VGEPVGDQGLHGVRASRGRTLADRGLHRGPVDGQPLGL